jgi:hypothetical protein
MIVSGNGDRLVDALAKGFGYGLGREAAHTIMHL